MLEQETSFDDEKLNRLDIEWIIYNALREGVGLSLRKLGLAGHRDTLRLAHDKTQEILPPPGPQGELEDRLHYLHVALIQGTSL